MQMAPPSACRETKAIVVVWKDPPFEPLFSTFVIYQCQRDYAGSLEDAEKRCQLEPSVAQRPLCLDHLQERMCSAVGNFKKSLDKAAQLQVSGFPAQSISRIHYPESKTGCLPAYPSLPSCPGLTLAGNASWAGTVGAWIEVSPSRCWFEPLIATWRVSGKGYP